MVAGDPPRQGDTKRKKQKNKEARLSADEYKVDVAVAHEIQKIV